MERKTVKFEAKDINEEEGTFTGYASTFTSTPDAYGDVVDKGAFKKTITEHTGRIKILWNHNDDEPIGKPVELIEDGKGLLVTGKLTTGVQRAREVLALMRDGVINEMSIGYDTITDSIEKGVRHLKEIRLWDVSPVTFAANPDATITGVKSDLEKLLKSGRVLSATSRNKVQAALDALQALLEAAEGEQEPEKSTPEPEETTEAAEIEGMLDTIMAEIDGFDTKQAESNLDALLEKFKMEVKNYA